MSPNRKELITRLIKEAREFRFCGPSDDPDEQTAVTTGYHHLVVQFKHLAGPILPESAATRLNLIGIEFDDVYSAYKARAELDALLPDLESALETLDDNLVKIISSQKPTLSALFVNHAADVLAETSHGLTGSEIVRALSGYAIDLNVTIPHPVC